MTEILKNEQAWLPTKILQHGGSFRVNPFGLGPASYYVTLEAFRALNSTRRFLHGHLVDLGCGNVPYFEWYRDMVERVTCIDWPGSPHSSKHINLFADLNASVPLESSSADCVLATSVLEHIREPDRLFAEIHRILRTDGCAILSVPFLYHVHEEPHDYFRYTRQGLEYLSRETGFVIVSLESFGNAPGVLADTGSKALYLLVQSLRRAPVGIVFSPLKRVTAAVLRVFQYVMFAVFGIGWIRRVMAKTGLSDAFPLGYVMVIKKVENTIRGIDS